MSFLQRLVAVDQDVCVVNSEECLCLNFLFASEHS